VAEGIRRGFALTIDYGDTARRLYTPHRRRGTLAVYSQHQFGERPLAHLAHPGAQDITAHVNFTALIQAGRTDGMRLAGLTTQAAFLTALGLRARIAELGRPVGFSIGRGVGGIAGAAGAIGDGQLDYLRRISQRNALAALLEPSGLGGFKVLLQQRGVPGAARALVGLRQP
jgi:SAM-dependent MidA family methyltransferase